MESKIYEMNFDGKGLVEIDRKENDNLPMGQVVMWTGNMAWGPEQFVIVEKIVNDYFTGYNMVSLKDYDFHRSEAYTMRTKENERSQCMLILDEVLSVAETMEIKNRADLKKEFENEQKAKAELETERLIKKGKEIFMRYAPKDTKSVIVAKYETDESDSMTDYFATRTTDVVVLGFSKHNRDLFSEMRKYADLIPETADLKNVPEVDYNGEKRTEENKEWWTPADEHREKYSMGKGFYLKSTRGRGGWEICKQGVSMENLDNYSMNEIFISLAKRCVVGGAKK